MDTLAEFARTSIKKVSHSYLHAGGLLAAIYARWPAIHSGEISSSSPSPDLCRATYYSRVVF
jgi:hypothetical protein